MDHHADANLQTSRLRINDGWDQVGFRFTEIVYTGTWKRNDSLWYRLPRFRDTLGSSKETTGNGRTVDRVICESLPEDIYERDFLSKPLYFLSILARASARIDEVEVNTMWETWEATAEKNRASDPR